MSFDIRAFSAGHAEFSYLHLKKRYLFLSGLPGGRLLYYVVRCD